MGLHAEAGWHPHGSLLFGWPSSNHGQGLFSEQSYSAVLSSRDTSILLALAAAEGYTVYQTDVVRAFLHGKLDNVDIYIDPPARYQCPAGMVLKLLKAIYGLIQAPVKFKWRKLIGSEVTVILQQTMLNSFG